MVTSKTVRALFRTFFFIAVGGTPILVAAAIISFFPMPGIYQSIIATLGFIGGGSLFLRIYGNQGYRLNAKNFTVRTHLRSETVPYRRVTEVAKVRRGRSGGNNGTGAKEHIQVRYEKSNGESATVQLSPQDPGALLHQLVSACPHLSEYAQARVIKTSAFREAEAALSDEADEEQTG